MAIIDTPLTRSVAVTGIDINKAHKIMGQNRFTDKSEEGQ